MPYNATSDLWYQYFTQDGPQTWILLGVYAIRMLFSTVGTLFNASVVSLHGTCNILIAAESFFAIFLDVSFYFYVSFFIMLSGVHFIQNTICFPILILPSTGGNIAQMIMVLTGIDRLLAVLFPLWYKQRKGQFYLGFCCIVVLCYAVYQIIIGFMDYESVWDIMLSCSTKNMGSGRMGPLMRINGLVLSGMMMGIYALVWLMVFKVKKTSKNLIMVSKKLVKALVFIIAFNLIGVFIRHVITFIFIYVPINVFIKKSDAILLSFLTIAVYSANAPILYVTSKEYRSIFNKHFPWLDSLFNDGNTPKMQNNIVNTTTNYCL